MELLRRFFWDGYYAAKHALIITDRDLPSGMYLMPDPLGEIGAPWRCMIDNFNDLRFAKRSFVYHAPAFMVLLLVGVSRLIGWILGLKQFGRRSVRDHLSVRKTIHRFRMWKPKGMRGKSASTRRVRHLGS